MFIIPLQCRIFEQGSEHFQQITLFYTSVGSETGLKRRILFCPNICGLENKRSRSTSFQGGSANICGLENKRSRSTGFQGGSASTSPHQPQSREQKILIHDWEALLHSYSNSYSLRNDRSRSRVVPVDFSDFLSAPVVGTVLHEREDV